MSINQCICFLLHHLSCPRDPSPRKKKKRSFVRSFVRRLGRPQSAAENPPLRTRRVGTPPRLDSTRAHHTPSESITNPIYSASSPRRRPRSERNKPDASSPSSAPRRIRVGGALLNANRLRIISSKAPSHRIHPRRHLDPSVSRIAYRVDVYIYLRTFRSSSPPRSSSSSSSFVRSFVRSFWGVCRCACPHVRAHGHVRRTRTRTRVCRHPGRYIRLIDIDTLNGRIIYV